VAHDVATPAKLKNLRPFVRTIKKCLLCGIVTQKKQSFCAITCNF